MESDQSSIRSRSTPSGTPSHRMIIRQAARSTPNDMLPRELIDSVLQSVQPPAMDHRDDPVRWIQETGGQHLWSLQQEIVRSVFTNRYTAVPACHGPGKSFVAAWIAAAWIACHEPGEGFVLSTAPSWPQVKAILWRELKRAHSRSNLPGRITLNAEWIIPTSTGEELVAIGRKPADHDDDGFQGIHAKKVLVILDEACGIPVSLWNGVYSIVTTPGSSVLAIGNPDFAGNEFERVCQDPSWNVIPIPFSKTPAATGEEVPPQIAESLVNLGWVEEARERWGERSPIYQSKVEARFPEHNEDGVYSIDAMSIGTSKIIERDPTRMICLAVDIAREGDDDTVAYEIDASGLAVPKFILHTNTLTEVAGRCVSWANEHPSAIVIVDADGLGAGVYDMLKEQRVKVKGFRASKPARDSDQYVNARAEGHHLLNQALEQGRIIAHDPNGILRAELATVRRIIDSKGRLGIESKENAAKRGIRSPNHVDALMMAAWTLRLGERRRGVRVSDLATIREAGGSTYAE